MSEIRKLNKSEILKASEISQYSYCSVGWFLRRYGFTPSSESVKNGINIHAKIGEKIGAIKYKELSLKQTLFIGCFLIFIIIVMLISSWLL